MSLIVSSFFKPHAFLPFWTAHSSSTPIALTHTPFPPRCSENLLITMSTFHAPTRLIINAETGQAHLAMVSIKRLIQAKKSAIACLN
jgi:hypothetical protein